MPLFFLSASDHPKTYPLSPRAALQISTEGVTETEAFTTGTRQYFETSTVRIPETTTFTSSERPSSTGAPRVFEPLTEKTTTAYATATQAFTTPTPQYFETSTL